MARPFGETVRSMREARSLGLREAADRLGISPAYLSRIERGKERPPRPDVIKRIATLLGGDPDLLFRLSESTDPELAEYLHVVPAAAKFLRSARTLGLTDDEYEKLVEEIVEVRRKNSSASSQ